MYQTTDSSVLAALSMSSSSLNVMSTSLNFIDNTDSPSNFEMKASPNINNSLIQGSAVYYFNALIGATLYINLTANYGSPTAIIFSNNGTALVASISDSSDVTKSAILDFVAPRTGIYYLATIIDPSDKNASLVVLEDQDTSPAYTPPPPNNPPTGTVEIIGMPSQYQTLTATNNLADLDGLGTISHQWLKDGEIISGANKSTYVLTAADVGKSISVQASYIDELEHSENVVSDTTELVTPRQNSVPTGTLKIKGTLTQTQTLSVIDTLVDSDGLGTINYQWLKDGEIISGADKSTYVLTAADIGKSISVQANYTDLLGTFESVTSLKTANIIAITSKKPTDGNDQLTGTVKNDTLTGGLGADTLTGGLGADIFKFNNVKETGVDVKTRDTIIDFKTSEGDKINLSGIDANTNRTDDQAFTKFDVGEKFLGKFTKTNALFFETSTHILYGNVDAKSGADFSIQLSGVTNLVASDFVL